MMLDQASPSGICHWWHQEVLVQSVATETIIIPGQWLMWAMPRSWQQLRLAPLIRLISGGKREKAIAVGCT